MPSPVALFVYSALSWLGLAAQEPVPPGSFSEQSVLEKLVQFDSIYQAGFTARGTQRRMDRISVLGPFYRVDTRWKLTSEGGRIGYDMEVVDRETPKYLPPDQRPWLSYQGAGLAPAEETMMVAVRAREWGYWGDEGSGNLEVDHTVSIAPDGQSTKGPPNANAYVYGVKDIQANPYRYTFEWALGRFFSDRIDKITAVETLDEDRLQVSALGMMYAGFNGRWELEIEPGAGWIVRKARFYDGSNELRSQMVNEGTVWKGPFCIPKEARVNLFGPVEDLEAVPATYTRVLTFEPVVDRFDETLYEECRQAVLHNKQPELLVTDARVSPRQYTRPNLPEPTIDKTSRSGRIWIVLANVIGIGCVFVAWGVFRRHRRRITSAGSG